MQGMNAANRDGRVPFTVVQTGDILGFGGHLRVKESQILDKESGFSLFSAVSDLLYVILGFPYKILIFLLYTMAIEARQHIVAMNFQTRHSIRRRKFI